MTKRERISSVDTAWLRMDRPTNHMMIVGILIFEDSLDYERLRRAIESRLLRFDRFRQKVSQEAMGAFWEEDQHFDLDHHLHRVALPGRGGKDELQKMVADLATSPLDPAKPLWQFHLVENYDHGAVLIARIHHCIADGIALVGVMLSLTDEAPDAAEPFAPAPGVQADEEPNPWRTLIQPVTQATIAAINMSTTAWLKYLDLLSRPSQVLDYGRHGVGFTTELAKLLAMPADSPSRFKGKPGSIKRVAWSERLGLPEIKVVGKALGCSVNDVLLGCVTGALRRYLLDHGDNVSGVEVRALVPVNLRGDGDGDKLGNRFGLVTLLLPVGEGNPLARVFEVRRRMQELKDSYQAPLSLGILATVGMAPKLVQQQFLDMLSAKASAVMTNVPGPQKPLYLAGAKLGQIMFWVPQSGDLGMGVSILSYNDGVQFGLMTDRNLVPDPEAIVGFFQPEFNKLLLAVLLEPEQAAADPAALEQSLEQEASQPQTAAPEAPPRHAKTVREVIKTHRRTAKTKKTSTSMDSADHDTEGSS